MHSRSITVPLLLLSIFAVSGCSTPLSDQGRTIQIVETKENKDCKFLGTISGFDGIGFNAGDESDNTLNEIRNKAAKMGANAIRIFHMQSALKGTSATAEALMCDSSKF